MSELGCARQALALAASMGLFEGDQRVYVIGSGGGEPGAQRARLLAVLQRVPADAEARIAKAESLEARVVEHFRALVADTNDERGGRRG